jgi:hypothetical protein
MQIEPQTERAAKDAVWAVAAFFSMMIVSTSCIADDCDTILEHGIRNTYQSLNSSNLNSDVRNAMCSSGSSSSGNSAGGGLGLSLPIDDIPISFNGNYNQKQLQ